MRKIKSFAFIVGATLLVIASGCKKEGPMGPMGPRGYTGQTGPQGPTGTINDSLKSFTHEFTMTFDENTSAGIYMGITEFEKGDMLVTYVNSSPAAGNWSMLPYLYNGVMISSTFSDVSGHVTITTAYTNGSTASPWPSTVNIAFKVLIVKPADRVAHPHLDFSNYDRVKETLQVE